MSFSTISATTNTTYNLTKAQTDNYVQINVSGAYTGLTFTVAATTDGTNFANVGVIDLGTLATISNGTSISPSNNATYDWAIPLANGYTATQINVSAISTGTAVFKSYGYSLNNGPTFLNVTNSTTSFTNGTFSGTLAVTGTSTLTGNVSCGGTLSSTGNFAVNTNKFTVTASSGNTVSAGSILSNAPTGGIGYTTGAGGTVTQSTSKATGVTLNKITGQITLNNAALAASATVTFVLTNSTIAATSEVRGWVVSGETTPGSYGISFSEPGSGTINCNVRNVTAGSLSEAIVVGYSVYSAAAS